MDFKSMTIDTLRAIIEKAENEIRERFLNKSRKVNERLISGPAFSDNELIYSAWSRCPCGHGMAYPKDTGVNGYWDCSAILKGIADKDVQHTDKLPFVFWDIKSENQASAYGATTRPNSE